MKTLTLTLILVFATTLAVAKDYEEVEMEKRSEGRVVAKDHYLDIADDRKVMKVASNVIRLEQSGKYVERRVGALEAKVDTLESQIQTLEGRIKTLEEAKPSPLKGKPVVF